MDHETHNEDIVDELDDDFIRQLENSTINNGVDSDASDLGSPSGCDVSLHHVELSAVEVKRSRCTVLQRNAAVTCDFTQTIPRPVGPSSILMDNQRRR